MGDMKVRVEVWPVAADKVGIWLLSGGDAWRGPNIGADGDVQYEVVSLLADHDIWLDDTAVTHSTSWRPDGPAVVLTYVAVVKADGFVKDRWPDARPVTADLLAVVGKPPTHAATDAPLVRYVDVLAHGIRHLAYLEEHSAEEAAAMGETWRRHLEPLEPALAGMYSERHVAA